MAVDKVTELKGLSRFDREVVDKGLDMLDASLKRMAAKASPAVLEGIETDRKFVAAVRQRVAGLVVS